MNDRLLDRIDKAASARGLTRSKYFSQLAEQEIAKMRGPGRTQFVRQTMQQIDGLFQQQSHNIEATAAVRQARDAG